MKKVAIVTLYGNFNFGNKLQNYAMQEVLKKLNCFEVETILNKPIQEKDKIYYKNRIKEHFENDFLRFISKKYKIMYKNSLKRDSSFLEFDKLIKKTKEEEICNNPNPLLENNYDYFVVGSDQVWNPYFNHPKDEIKSLYLLDFIKDNNKKIAYSASIGVDTLPYKSEQLLKNNISNFKAISVREQTGKDILKRLTKRNDIEVLLDPTMLLSTEDWDKVIKKPTNLNFSKYILIYFIGNLSNDRLTEINRFARENACEVINLADKSSPFYECGPSEFIYLEKNAYLICTDSFHSSVFAILYNRPFLIFPREDYNLSMNSRLETLLSKFKLDNKTFNGTITQDNLNLDYENTYKILEEEKKKSFNYLNKALDVYKNIDDSEIEII